MAQDDSDDIVSTGALGGSAAEALALDGASRASADAYLKEQIALTRRQREYVEQQDEFELSHLRWRRFNDQMRGALQIMLVALGLLVVVAIAATLWNASQADGLVIDAFTVPPSWAAQGMAGDVLASDITDRVNTIRNIAVANSLSNSSSVRKSDADAVKVEIPDTGVSLGEVWRYLRSWLGNEQHVAGSLRQLPDGRISLRATIDGNIVTVEGRAADLDALEQQLAEKIFAVFDPTNVTIFLWNTNRLQDAYAQATWNVTHDTPGIPRSTAYSLWSDVTREINGDVPLAIVRAKAAIALEPDLAAALNELGIEEAFLGHDEAALAAERDAASLSEAAQPKRLQGEGFLEVRSIALEQVAKLTGDFAAAERAACRGSCLPNWLDYAALYAARRHDAKSAYAFVGEARALAHTQPIREADALYYAALAQGDWSQAATRAEGRLAVIKLDYPGAGPLHALSEQTFSRPMLTEALVAAGNLAGAEGAISSTPRDCYNCVRMRGVVAAAEKNWSAAAYWFDDAVKQAPSIPYAYLDWGRTLMAKGDVDGAIAKFSLAHDKGPNFADPLEAWGEALMAKNRSDLALEKFALAGGDAPNWGRLHLKWGEALFYAGDRSGTKKELALAATLTLTPAERTELARFSAQN